MVWDQFSLLDTQLDGWRAKPGWLAEEEANIRLIRAVLPDGLCSEAEIIATLAALATNTFR